MSKKDLAMLLYDFITKELEAGKTGVTNKTEKVDAEGKEIKVTFYGSGGENLVLIIDDNEINLPKEEAE